MSTTSPARGASASRGRIATVVLVLAAFGLGLYLIGRGTFWGLPSPPHQFDRYWSLGPEAGSRALQQDLVRDHPVGSDLGSLLTRLDRAGFECRAQYRPVLVHACEQRRTLGTGGTGQIAILVRAEGVAVAGIEATLSMVRH